MNSHELPEYDLQAMLHRGRVERSLAFHRFLRSSVSQVKNIFLNRVAEDACVRHPGATARSCS